MAFCHKNCDKWFSHPSKFKISPLKSSAETEADYRLMVQDLDYKANYALKFPIQVLSVFAGQLQLYMVLYCRDWSKMIYFIRCCHQPFFTHDQPLLRQMIRIS